MSATASNQKPNRSYRKWIVMLLVISGLVAVVWWQQTRILTWYYVRNLVEATDSDRATWVDRVVALDAAALPSLLNQLTRENKQACVNVEAALTKMAGGWGVDDDRAIELITSIQRQFSKFSTHGQRTALQAPIVLLQSKQNEKPHPIPATITLAIGKLLTVSAKNDDPSVRARTLEMASLLLDRVPKGQWGATCRRLAEESFSDRSHHNRVLAVHLALRPALHKDKRLLEKMVPLLRDSTAEVRRAALVAVGTSPLIVPDEDLLPLLHDPDPNVKDLCEIALRSRGLQDHHLVMAKLITHKEPIARLDVFEHLRHAKDLDPAIWLRRLSRDPSPAVRVAAIREAAGSPEIDLRDRIVEMAKSDPSETVRELAGYYLKQIDKVR